MTDPKNLESWLHEKAGPAYDALKADPARAITPDQVRRTLDELLAEAEAAGQHPLPPEQREWVDAPAVGREWPACETLEGEGLANIASSDDDGRRGGSHRHS